MHSQLQLAGFAPPPQLPTSMCPLTASLAVAEESSGMSDDAFARLMLSSSGGGGAPSPAGGMSLTFGDDAGASGEAAGGTMGQEEMMRMLGLLSSTDAAQAGEGVAQALPDEWWGLAQPPQQL